MGDIDNAPNSLPELCNKQKAAEIYRWGLPFCDQPDREVIEERLDNL
ncbi:hypothetical protein [Effusibacillus consociatus]|uniref:Uncharacterized protein n=1 Tax=Effusibacillus consociatus TaxID=1117041 RepID=A0ABV9Q0G9_9BACL